MKPKEGDRCVGIITAVNPYSNTLYVPGLIHPTYPQCNNKAYTTSTSSAVRKGLYVGKIHWFEYRRWPASIHCYWQPLTQEEIEIEINRQEQ